MENNELMSELADSYFRSQTPAIKVLYLDIRCLQDFNMGALLNLINSEKEYQYVLDNIETYNKRNNLNIMEYFPKLDITEDQIKNYINNEENHRHLLLSSPMTDYYKYFSTFISAIDFNNKHSPDHVTPHIYIGSPIIKLSFEEKQRLMFPIKQFALDYFITITDCGVEDYDDLILKSIDHYTVLDFNDLMTNKRLGALMHNGEIVVNKSVHAYPIITTKDSDLTDEQLLENTEIVYKYVCDFKYVTMALSVNRAKQEDLNNE